MVRWTIRIVVVLLVLLLAATVIVHFVLRSDWLRETALARASRQLGLDVDAEALSIEWGGVTTIRDVTVQMPLTEEVVLAADRIQIAHTSIPALIFGRPVTVQAVEVNDPEVSLRRYDNGRWNVQDVWDRLRASFDSTDKPKGPTSLPRIAVTNAQVRFVEPNGFTEVVGPLNFRGRPGGRLVWLFDLEWPETTGVEGQLVSGGDWAHDVGFAVEGIAPLVQRLTGADLSPIRVAGRWEGRVAQGGTSGTIQLERFTVGPVAAHGGIAIQARSGQVTVRPRNLVVSEPNLAGRPIRLTSGSIRITEQQIQVMQLAAASELLAARVNGAWDLSAQTGEFSGSWTAASDGNLPQYSGTYQAAVKSPPTGRKVARVSLAADAAASFGELALAATIEGNGVDWQHSRWQIAVPTLAWSREDRQVDLAGATAEIHVAWPAVRLASMHLPDAEVTKAEAQFNAETQQWSVHLAVDDMAQLKPWGLTPVDLQLNAEGDDSTARIAELRAAEDGRTVTVQGGLSFRERGFQDIRLVADWPAGSTAPEQGQAQRPVGRWHLEGDVFGWIQPLAIKVTGQMTGQNITLGKKTVGRVEVPVQAQANAEGVEMTTDTVELLGGRWKLGGRHDLSTRLTKIAVTADNLELGAVAAMAGLPLDSHGRAHAEIELAMKGFDAGSAVATGSWTAQDVNIPPLQAEQAQGRLRIADGLVQFNEILLQRGSGRAQASAEFRLDDPQFVFVELTSSDWPAQVEPYPVLAYVDGKAKLRVNLIRRTAQGEARLSGEVLLQDKELARLRVVAAIEEQTVNIEDFYAETLGGDVEGAALVRLNDWKSSTAQLAWKGIRPKLLQPWVSQFERFEGDVSGTLLVKEVPKEDRPPEPMRFEVNADIENGHFGAAQVDVCCIEGYFGPTRLLLDNIDLDVLEGQLEARARVSKHAGQHYGTLSADFNDLNLNQLVRVLDPNAGEYIGRFSGNATLLGSSSWDSFGGEAQIKLSQSDLVSNSVVRILHNSLSLQFGEQKPTGTGEITVRLEGPAVVIPSASYFNRGVEIRGAGRIANVNRGAESAVEGFAVGSTRVLKGISLPGIRSLDRLLATFQAGAASVQIDGTLGDVKVDVVPLPVILGSFRNLLWAQLGE